LATQVYDNEDELVEILKANEDRYPAIGEISFFLGIPQVYTFTGAFHVVGADFP